MNFFRGFSLNTTCSFLVFSLGFVNSVLLADQLGPEHYGTLKLWTALVMLGVLVLGEWLSKGNIYVVGTRARAGGRDQPHLVVLPRLGCPPVADGPV